MSVLEALKGVLKLALIHDGLARGLREASKALDRRQAHMCVLNEGCEEEAYKKLVVALCGEHGIPLIKVPDGKMLGEWAGLCESFLSFCVFLLLLLFGMGMMGFGGKEGRSMRIFC
jgi:small subunit ribosomal protein S12e